MKYFILFILLISVNYLFANDHLDAWENVNLEEDGFSSTSIFPLLAIVGVIFSIYKMLDFFMLHIE